MMHYQAKLSVSSSIITHPWSIIDTNLHLLITRCVPAAGETVKAEDVPTVPPPGLVVTTIYCAPGVPGTPRGIAVNNLAGGAPGRFGLGDAITIVCLPPTTGD